MTDWKIFLGDGSQHDGLTRLPPPPPWRFSREQQPLQRPDDLDLAAEARRAAPFLADENARIAVNAALYLRRPLLITGNPGTGKSTLIAKVAHELKLGPVIRWPIGSTSTVRAGIYEYDAVGRLQASKQGEPPVQDYLTLGPLGTALNSTTWPRPLLIDEIDKSDLDFANDLLNVIEEGEYLIPELQRLGTDEAKVKDCLGNLVSVKNGRIESGQFPFVVMTSNGEREFPPPFLRRCVRLKIEDPSPTRLEEIIHSHLAQYPETLASGEIGDLIDAFDKQRRQNEDLATDQLLNAVFLTLAVRDDNQRSFTARDLERLREELLRPLSGPKA